MYGRDWRRPEIPAQLQLRIAILGGVGLVMFVIIFLRLWYLEVLSGDQYLAEAENNQVREVTVQAPRGLILDRNGEPLVTNRTALELQVKASDLPQNVEARRRLFDRLAELTRKSPAEVRKSIREQTKELPSSPATIQRDVPYDTVYFLRENQDRFPGVSVERVYVRQYPQGTLAAHLLGYVREVSPGAARGASVRDAAAGRHDRPGRRRVGLRRPAARRSTARPGSRSTPPATRPAGR